YPLDIWSLYMQSAVQKYPVQEFDTPSPDLPLEVKTDGRAYVKPEPPPEPEKPKEEKPKEEKRKDTKKEDPRPEITVAKPEEPGFPEEQPPSPPDSNQDSSSQQVPASASPSSASPGPDGDWNVRGDSQPRTVAAPQERRGNRDPE
ncbi:MAG TPA: hypothetical protein VFY54_15895, partial [Rubrobacter sp.]|nr:hypothetical protein [Rubrobacter sp.]